MITWMSNFSQRTSPIDHFQFLVEKIGSMMAGEALYFKGKCAQKCEFGEVKTVHKFGGDTDVYGKEKMPFKGWIKCFSNECICAGTSSHPTYDKCLKIADTTSDEVYFTVRSALASEEVKLVIESYNMYSLESISHIKGWDPVKKGT